MFREATGASLPKRWQPGMPLPRTAKLVADTVSACPSGQKCRWCNDGQRWDGTRHVPVQAGPAAFIRNRRRKTAR